MNSELFEPRNILLLMMLLITLYTDFMHRKIYNAVTLPMIVIGWSLNLSLNGWAGFGNCLLGSLVGFSILFIIFILGGMGGGDVKLAAAIGALKGFPFIINAIFFSMLVGGVMALVVLLWTGRLWRSLKNIFRFLLTWLIPGLTTVPLGTEDSIKIPYGVAIALGTLISLFTPQVAFELISIFPMVAK